MFPSLYAFFFLVLSLYSFSRFIVFAPVSLLSALGNFIVSYRCVISISHWFIAINFCSDMKNKVFFTDETGARMWHQGLAFFSPPGIPSMNF